MKLVIARLGHLGDGIADGPDGAPVFVPGALPGEVVEYEPGGPDGSARIRILSPSRARVQPSCPHARTCGGCQLQHVSDDLVREWKRNVVIEALLGQGLPAPVREDVPTSPPGSRRRATLAGRRTKGGVLLGFRMKGSHQIVAVPHCHLLHSDLIAAWEVLKEIVRLCASRKDELSLTVTQSLTGLDVMISGGQVPDAGRITALGQLAERGGLARICREGTIIAQQAPPEIAMGKARVALPPGAFMQATAEGEAALRAAVAEALGQPARILDLFCGMGTFCLPLAEKAEIHAIDGDPALIRALDQAARRTPGLRPLSHECRDLFRDPLGPDELVGFDAVLIDPPRAGAEAQAARLSGADMAVIAMVSCNPVSFARDARILNEGGYQLDWVQVIDQFRWSTHIELVARFRLDAAGRDAG